MNPYQLSLKDVLELKSDKQLCPEFSNMESIDLLKKVRKKTAKFKGLKWPKLYNEILKRTADLLDLKIIKIISDAWINNDIFEKFQQIRDAKEDETVLIPVAEHCIESKHCPCLEILINDNVEAKVNFEINLSIEMKGIILKILNRKLMEIHTGECTIKGKVNCENVEVIDIESKTIKLPDIIEFEKAEQPEEAVIS